MSKPPGELAVVLHSHMPYVEGFGTWPFGEEWLWEAITTSYIPLLPLLDQAELTLSVTPVLADQLAADGVAERYLQFCEQLRVETHAQDAAQLRSEGSEQAACAVELSAEDYRQAAAKFRDFGGDLNGQFQPQLRWTSSATHAILPLLATERGIRLQVQAGIDSYRQRFQRAADGFWLPECAFSSSLLPLLAEAGVEASCLELTALFGLGDVRNLAVIESSSGIKFAPLDRQTVDLAWGAGGYPADPAYRNYHALTTYHHRAWANDGQPYSPERALIAVKRHAQDFVQRVIDRLKESASQLKTPPLLTFAVDTELLGHWWYEGVKWLEAVLDQAEFKGLKISYLDQALERHPPQQITAEQLPNCSWGSGCDLSTWSGPQVADTAWRLRAAELDLLLGSSAATDPRALRELLALQSSDWAFLITNTMAGDYPQQRLDHHHRELYRRIALQSATDSESALRNLAPYL